MNLSSITIKNIAVKKGGFELELNKAFTYKTVLPNPICKFRYKWDFSTGYGLAYLIAIDSTPVNITLFPLGAEGMWDFVSDMPPTKYLIKGKPVVIYRVALNIDPFTGEESAAILFNPYGSCIMSTGNFDIYCTSLTA